MDSNLNQDLVMNSEYEGKRIRFYHRRKKLSDRFYLTTRPYTEGKCLSSHRDSYDDRLEVNLAHAYSTDQGEIEGGLFYRLSIYEEDSIEVVSGKNC